MLSAAPALEAPQQQVGRRTARLVDHERSGRVLLVDVWYPAAVDGEALSTYEPLPSIVIESAVAHEAPAVRREPSGGRFPLVVVSHGRTGMRVAYSLLCEALAARGLVVVAADHPGDALSDWLGGTFVDDRTNEIGRLGDAAFLLAWLLGDPTGAEPPADLVDAIDPDRIAIVGHSYGAYTGLAAAAGDHGRAADPRVGAVVALQGYTRTMAAEVLSRVAVPTLLVVSEFDRTTPAATDAERPWSSITATPTWRLDLAGAAHHASSDMGLYLDLARQMSDLPAMVTAYVAMMRSEMTGEQMRPWRERLLVQIRAISAFFDIALDIDPARGEREAAAVASSPGVVLRRR